MTEPLADDVDDRDDGPSPLYLVQPERPDTGNRHEDDQREDDRQPDDVRADSDALEREDEYLVILHDRNFRDGISNAHGQLSPGRNIWLRAGRRTEAYVYGAEADTSVHDRRH